MLFDLLLYVVLVVLLDIVAIVDLVVNDLIVLFCYC